MAWKKRKNNPQQAEQGKQRAERRPRLVEPGWRDRQFVRKTISLNVPEAKALANYIPGISGACCIIGFAMQRYVEDIRVLSLLQSVDEEIFQTLGKDLENECKRLETLIAEEGVKRESCFPNPVKVQVEITHPYGLEYAKMVENMDKLVILLCDLFNARLLNEVQLNKARDKWYQLIRDAGWRISKLARDTLNQARQEKAQQDGKEAGALQKDDTETAAASALLESQSTGVPDTTAPEAAKPQEILPGGNGGRKSSRKAATTAAHAPGAEDLSKEVGPAASTLAASEELPPPLEQAV
ncbi:MAG: hypothetical protein ACYDIC_18155 [Desulfobaccales bacterium]